MRGAVSISNGAQQMTGVASGSGSFATKYARTSQVEVVQQQTSTNTYKLVYGRVNQIGMPVIEQGKIGSVTWRLRKLRLFPAGFRVQAPDR